MPSTSPNDAAIRTVLMDMIMNSQSRNFKNLFNGQEPSPAATRPKANAVRAWIAYTDISAPEVRTALSGGMEPASLLVLIRTIEACAFQFTDGILLALIYTAG
ncbi:hypothetical protein SIIN_6129_T [Serendipita indica DSM 11827]|nr:hypothetical protein SIIN_6129_T [Serendipita indica DSM 11827]